MENALRKIKKVRFWLALPALASCLIPSPALAQDDEEDDEPISRRSTQRREYAYNEEGFSGRGEAQEERQQQGAVRLAYFTLAQGDVSFRADENGSWATASVNLPLRQNAQIWVAEKGRAEIQFDDGSLLRLAANTLVTFQVLHSDSDGAYTGIKITSGLASLRLRHEHTAYQIDTPFASVRATGPARLRIGAGDSVEIAVREGQATVEGPQGKARLEEGDYLYLEDAESGLEKQAIPREDAWERWVAERDARLDVPNRPSKKYLPENIDLVAPNLDDYGDWRRDEEYGQVWTPRQVNDDWRPYQQGRWTWVNPFGWTWVSYEPWGWAPYHYGTWVSRPFGWAWVPGPATQYWCPAVVHFVRTGSQVVWTPLAPHEVRYPTLINIGFRRGNWFRYFSIGQAAVYYPYNDTVCAPRPWSNGYVNTSWMHAQAARNNAFVSNANQLAQLRFQPRNGVHANGAMITDMDSFGGAGAYRGLPRSMRSLFGQSSAVVAPPLGRMPVAGPAEVQPNYNALTPTRILNPRYVPPQQVLDRRVYRGIPPSGVLRQRTQPNASPSAADRLNQRPRSNAPQFQNPTPNQSRPYSGDPSNTSGFGNRRNEGQSATQPERPRYERPNPSDTPGSLRESPRGREPYTPRQRPTDVGQGRTDFPGTQPSGGVQPGSVLRPNQPRPYSGDPSNTSGFGNRRNEGQPATRPERPRYERPTQPSSGATGNGESRVGTGTGVNRPPFRNETQHPDYRRNTPTPSSRPSAADQLNNRNRGGSGYNGGGATTPQRVIVPQSRPTSPPPSRQPDRPTDRPRRN